MSTVHPPPAYEPRRALHVGGRQLFALAFSSLGIIYSDIGTSPLYVLTTLWSTEGPAPDEEDVIGGISAIVWAFTLLPLIKYVIFALSFGTGQGEGGPFALFQEIYPRHSPDYDPDDDRVLTTYTTLGAGQAMPAARSKLMQKLRWPLQIWTLFATALTISDGILTPAVSVTSSVGGLAVVAPVVADNVVPISIAFLVVLFCGQRFGTAKLSFVFAPMTLLWFALIGISGVINVTTAPKIFRAFDPSRAIMFFVRTKNFDALAGVLLSLTGCEAIFANLGQFSAASIRISFVFLVYPALVFAYLGQGARLIVDGENVMKNPFYLSIPGGSNGGLWWLTWVMGVFATLIASQAMITATYTLVNQLIGMKSFPAIRISHTSSLTAGQVYVPAVNWLLMIGTIATVAGFGSSFALTLAYGFAVATVMFITTTLISLQIPLVKGYHWSLGVAFFAFFGFLDACFWGAALKKVPEGAWFPLALGSLLCALMVFWTWGQELEHKFDRANARNLNGLVFNSPPEDDEREKLENKAIAGESIEEVGRDVTILASSVAAVRRGAKDIACDSKGSFTIKRADGTALELQRTSTLAIFYKSAGGKGVPHAFSTFLHQVPALPRVVIFLSTWTSAAPRIELEDRYVITKVRSLDGFYGVTMKRGYLDRNYPEVDHILSLIRSIEVMYSATDVAERMDRIKEASRTVTHINASYRMISARHLNPIVNCLRRILIEEIYARVRVMFPDESSSPDSLEESLDVRVLAEI